MVLSSRVKLACLLAFVLSSALGYGQVAVFPASSGDVMYRAGAISFSFPSPRSQLVETGSDLRVLFEPLVPDTNRLVAAFISPADLNAARSGTAPPLQDYALIEVPRRAEFANIDPDGFKQVSDAVGKQFSGDLTGTVEQQQEEVNRRLKALGSANSVTLDKPVLLGTLFAKPDAFAYGMVMPYSSNNKFVKVAMALNVIRVRNRVIFAYLYSAYKDEDTVTFLKITDEEWADAILKSNL